MVEEVNSSLGFHVLLVTGEIERDDKLALFQNADVLLDTQVKDGLNLHPFEFIACHKEDKRGMTILQNSRENLRSIVWNSGHSRV